MEVHCYGLPVPSLAGHGKLEVDPQIRLKPSKRAGPIPDLEESIGGLSCVVLANHHVVVDHVPPRECAVKTPGKRRALQHYVVDAVAKEGFVDGPQLPLKDKVREELGF